jgi:hypothetical protein
MTIKTTNMVVYLLLFWNKKSTSKFSLKWIYLCLFFNKYKLEGKEIVVYLLLLSAGRSSTMNKPFISNLLSRRQVVP